MTRLFLVAGVAALAIAAPSAAKPGGGHGNGGGDGGAPAQQGGGGHGQGGGREAAQQGGGGRGHGGGGGQAVFMGGGGHGRGGGGFAAPQMQRAERRQARGFERQQSRGFARMQTNRFERQQARQQARGFERQQARNVERQQSRGFERRQARMAERQQSRGFERRQARMAERQQARGFERQQARMAERQQFHANGQQQVATNQQFNAERMDRGNKGAKLANQQFVQQNWNSTNFAALDSGNRLKIRPVTQVEQFVGAPIGAVAGIAALSPNIQYLYPDTPDYYYRYGDGYLYQVDRGDDLIAALIPLLAGGYLPGQYLPAPYMASYVPDYYGFDSFYPDSPYTCNRYYHGVIYQVDCATGLVEDVIPMYAGGYGVGQLLPSAYSYYNVPMQYRGLYYDTPDYGYWYSPGAIYQYDTRSSLITSVAALMSPGFSLGQPLPLGYSAYNVPYAYRATYYDTPDAWYRYNNGYIYQVDPTTSLVTAIVASLLT